MRSSFSSKRNSAEGKAARRESLTNQTIHGLIVRRQSSTPENSTPLLGTAQAASRCFTPWHRKPRLLATYHGFTGAVRGEGGKECVSSPKRRAPCHGRVAEGRGSRDEPHSSFSAPGDIIMSHEQGRSGARHLPPYSADDGPRTTRPRYGHGLRLPRASESDLLPPATSRSGSGSPLATLAPSSATPSPIAPTC